MSDKGLQPNVIIKPVVDLRYLTAFLIFSTGILTGFLVYFFHSGNFKIKPEETKELSMSYADFLAITLTATGVLIAIVGIGIAFIALYGRIQIIKNAQKVAKNSASKAAKEKIEELIRNGDGELKSLLIKSAKEVMQQPSFRNEISKDLIIALNIASGDGSVKKGENRFGNEDDEYGDE